MDFLWMYSIFAVALLSAWLLFAVRMYKKLNE